ncbi:hypothetical protein [Noviherbaspirillum agri]
MLAMAARQPLELTMARHMLVQIPMLVAGGFLLGCFCRTAASQETGRRFAAFNENGLSGLSVFLLVSAYWMIPKALDDATASSSVEQAKFLTLVLAGFFLPLSLARANTVIQLFFVGNFSSMTAVVGLLYQDAPVRLCNAYLQDDQQHAGVGLVIIALTVPVLWYLFYKRNR